jgi:hypothetical protein
MLQHLVNYIETQFHTHVKFIRTDNAKELCEGDMLQFYLQKGIYHQRSCSHTPQQNGVVERQNQNLLETSRALSFQFNLPNMF